MSPGFAPFHAAFVVAFNLLGPLPGLRSHADPHDAARKPFDMMAAGPTAPAPLHGPCEASNPAGNAAAARLESAEGPDGPP